MLTPGALLKAVPEIVDGLREIRNELKGLRAGIDRGFTELLEQARHINERLDHMNDQVDHGMSMITSVLEDQSVTRGDAGPDELLKRAAAAARRAAKPVKKSR